MEMFKSIITIIYWVLLWVKFFYVGSHDCPWLTTLSILEIIAFTLIVGTVA